MPSPATPAPKRLRLVAVQLVPQFVVDDGETLTPVQPSPVVIPANAWASVVELFDRSAAAFAAEQGCEWP